MPHNVGKMFYYGEVPWHGLGTRLEEPADLKTALREGGLDWTVSQVPMVTDEAISSPTDRRVAVVRDDVAMGSPERVLGVVHRDFQPLQNRVGLELFDKMMGHKARYHTGGYLGAGERIWLLARVPEEMKVSPADMVEPYLLFSNSHDGTLAVDVRLTTVRVVCQNTLSLALADGNVNRVLKRRHDGMWHLLERDLAGFLEMWIKDVRRYTDTFRSLADVPCSDSTFENLLELLLPLPNPPAGNASSQAKKGHETKVRKTLSRRRQVKDVWQCGIAPRGLLFSGVQPEAHTLWGAVNAVTETVDHIFAAEKGRDPYYYSVFGGGDSLKSRAWSWATGHAQKVGAIPAPKKP